MDTEEYARLRALCEVATAISIAPRAASALLDEVERLRAALTAIYEGHGGGEHPVTLSHIDTQVLARRALEASDAS